MKGKLGVEFVVAACLEEDKSYRRIGDKGCLFFMMCMCLDCMVVAKEGKGKDDIFTMCDIFVYGWVSSGYGLECMYVCVCSILTSYFSLSLSLS